MGIDPRIKKSLFYRSAALAVIFIAAAVFTGCGAPAGPSSNANTQPPAPVTEATATFLSVGDIMLSRGVQRMIDRYNDPDRPFSAMADTFAAVDFSFGNLESPISGNDKIIGKGLVFNAHRKDTAGLVTHKFKILSIANNHALDQRIDGLRYTRSFLAEKGIEFAGAGENQSEAWEGKVITANGIRIGFIATSYASVNDGGVTKNDYVARIEDLDGLKNAIAALRTKCDIVAVSFHAGIEYTRQPHKPQVDFARAAIDLGADVVIGGHPHWIQTIEKYKGKYIFYSLGNFIFDQRQPGTTEGLTLLTTVRRKPRSEPGEPATQIETIELIPVIIENFGTPRKATAAESAAILKKIGIVDPVLRP